MLGQTLAAIRKRQGVSQKMLANDSATFQANISEIENGLVNPSFQTADLLFSQLGYRLIPVPFTGLTIQEWGFKINETLNSGNEKRAFRFFLQLNDELNEIQPEIIPIIVTTPPNITDIKYSALITSLVEWHLTNKKLPLPSWVRSDTEKLKTPWFVDAFATNEAKIKNKTPLPFLKRNILLAESELHSA